MRAVHLAARASPRPPFADAELASTLRELIHRFREGVRQHITAAWSDHLPLLARLPVRMGVRGATEASAEAVPSAAVERCETVRCLEHTLAATTLDSQ